MEIVLLSLYTFFMLQPIIIYSILFKTEKDKETRNRMILIFMFGFLTLLSAMLLIDKIAP